MTTNHDYETPAKGAKDWHRPLNDNFEKIDADVEIRDVEADRTDYEPKAVAKFVSTDTGRVYLGDGTQWRRLPWTGRDPLFDNLEVLDRIAGSRMETNSLDASGTVFTEKIDVAGQSSSNDVLIQADNGDAVRASTDSGANTATAVRAAADSDSGNTFGVYALNRSPDGKAVFGVNFASSGSAVGINGRSVSSSDGVGVRGSGGKYGIESLGDAYVKGNLEVVDDLDVYGDKNFVQAVETDEGSKEVVYTASEAGTPHTEASGVAELEDGRARVDLPDHFAWVTDSEEPLMVQVTAHASEPVRPQVTERSTHRIVIEDAEESGRSYEVSYTVKGTREGHADKRVVREPGDATDGVDADRTD